MSIDTEDEKKRTTMVETAHPMYRRSLTTPITTLSKTTRTLQR